jgi:hypothetical protein
MIPEEEEESRPAFVQILLLQSSGRKRLQLNDVYRQDAGYIVAETSPMNGESGRRNVSVEKYVRFHEEGLLGMDISGGRTTTLLKKSKYRTLTIGRSLMFCVTQDFKCNTR